MINSYPSVYAVGHAAISNLFDGVVQIEEKIDGSQFSFTLKDGELECRSKNVNFSPDMANSMFSKAVQTVLELKPHLQDGYTYRCEYLQKPKHNTLAYDRVPEKNLILFDVNTGLEQYLSYEEKKAIAAGLGLETVPLLYRGEVKNYDQFLGFLENISILGGCKIEGVVIKNYSQFSRDKKVSMGKYVSEGFKEIHSADWKDRNPGKKDIVEQIILSYRTPARWQKAVQHLKENGLYDGSPRDIGNLIKEVCADIEKECAEEIKTLLFNSFWKDIQRGITRGIPEWYKDELAKSAFKED